MKSFFNRFRRGNTIQLNAEPDVLSSSSSQSSILSDSITMIPSTPVIPEEDEVVDKSPIYARKVLAIITKFASVDVDLLNEVFLIYNKLGIYSYNIPADGELIPELGATIVHLLEKKLVHIKKLGKKHAKFDNYILVSNEARKTIDRATIDKQVPEDIFKIIKLVHLKRDHYEEYKKQLDELDGDEFKELLKKEHDSHFRERAIRKVRSR